MYSNVGWACSMRVLVLFIAGAAFASKDIGEDAMGSRQGMPDA